MIGGVDRSCIDLKEGLQLVFPADHPIDVRTLYVLSSWASANLGGKWVFCGGFLPGTSLAVKANWTLDDTLDTPFSEWEEIEEKLVSWVDESPLEAWIMVGIDTWIVLSRKTQSPVGEAAVSFERRYGWL